MSVVSERPTIDYIRYLKNNLLDTYKYGDTCDIDYRKTIEEDLVSAFFKVGINAVSSIEIVSPLKNYTNLELNKIYSDNNIDCILSVAVIDANEMSEYIPQQTYTNYRSEYQNGQLISVPYSTLSGGYSVSYPKASFEIKIKDLKTGELALKSTANSEGDEFSDMKTISKSLTKKIVLEYQKKM